MNQKQIGIILIIVGIILSVFTYVVKERDDAYIKSIMLETGSCFLEDGTCLHADRSIALYIIGWVISTGLILFGIYLAFIDKTYEQLTEHQVKVSTALENAKRFEKEKDEFNAYLAGFSSDQQKIMRAVHEQDGIKQSTLRFRVNMSKTTLSLILKSLEERGVIKRKARGKTNQVYLVKKF